MQELYITIAWRKELEYCLCCLSLYKVKLYWSIHIDFIVSCIIFVENPEHHATQKRVLIMEIRIELQSTIWFRWTKVYYFIWISLRKEEFVRKHSLHSGKSRFANVALSLLVKSVYKQMHRKNGQNYLYTSVALITLHIKGLFFLSHYLLQ